MTIDDFNVLVRLLCERKTKDSLIEVENRLIELKDIMFKKNPKSLDLVMAKTVFIEKDNISLILKGHLYIEKMLDDIIETEDICDKRLFLSKNNLIESTFNKKLTYINIHELLDVDLYNDIKLINKYRNKLAHNFEFKICELTLFNEISLYKGRPIKFMKKKIENEALFRFGIKLAFMYIFDRMYHKFDYLLALKTGGKRAKYHPLEL